MKRAYLLYFSLALLLAGCAPKGPVLTDFKYEQPKSAAGAAATVTVAVSPFKDDRAKIESVVGKRFNELNEQTTDLVVQGTVSMKVTEALKHALAARRIAARDAAAWDLTEAGIAAPAGADLLVGGEVKVLWVDATSQLANTKSKAEVQLRIVVADVAQKKIIRILNVSSKIERQNVANTAAFIERSLSEALTGAIDQLFADEELKSRLK
ncbi:MAG: hypothetical protein A2X58_07865 [Nitrospirae bacterium GWC2_56_14]|nr:MAG: hypothetical protein A2X58_07865 [Nitrospirae bacterium GWC2_56_14]